MAKLKISTCYYCERDISSLYEQGNTLLYTRDHIIPSSKGGNNTNANMLHACLFCNNLKDDLLPEDFLLLIESMIDKIKDIPKSGYDDIVAVIGQYVPLGLMEKIRDNIARLIDTIRPYRKQLYREYFNTIHENSRKTRRFFENLCIADSRKKNPCKKLFNFTHEVFIENHMPDRLPIGARKLTLPEPIYRIRQCIKTIDNTLHIRVYYPEIITSTYVVPAWNIWSKVRKVDLWGSFYYTIPTNSLPKNDNWQSGYILKNLVSFSTYEAALEWLKLYVNIKEKTINQYMAHIDMPPKEYEYSYYTENSLTKTAKS